MSQKLYKILILGASGMLGHKMWRMLHLWNSSQQNQIFGTVRKVRSHYEKLGLTNTQNLIENVDVSDFNSLKKVLDKVKPDVVINCVGLTLRKKDLGDIEKCYHLNSMLPQFVGKWCENNSAKLIHFSTDCVFDGKKGSTYLETDLPSAFDHYGQSKYLGEVSGGNNLTFRLSIVGRELENRSELVEWIISQKGKSVKGFAQARYSGLTTAWVAREVIRVLEKFPDLQGVYQVSSEPITKYEILQKMNSKFGLNMKIEANNEYKSDKTLDCSRYSKKTGFVKPNWDQMIDDLFLDREFYERL